MLNMEELIMSVAAHRDGKPLILTAGLGGALCVMMLSGCASDPPKPAPTVTPEQVRSHADKAFDKQKQEEPSRSTDSAVR